MLARLHRYITRFGKSKAHFRFRHLWENIKASLLYNILKMIILVVLLLWLLFQFIPREANVFIRTSDLLDYSYISSQMVDIESSLSSHVLSSDHEIRLSFSGACSVVTNDKAYENDSTIVVQPNLNSTAYIIMLNPNNSNASKTKLFTNSFPGKPSLSLEYDSDDPLLLIYDMPTFTTEQNSETLVRFYNAKVILAKQGLPDIKISECIVKPTSELRYSITFKGESGLGLSLPLYNARAEDTLNIRFTFVQTFVCKSSGSIKFSYSPSIKDYPFNKQLVSLTSVSGDMEANLSFSNGIIQSDAYGMVKSAEISNASLFPSFRGWYYDNIYLAPLAFITVIFGGVTLMINNRKKS